MTPPRPLAQTSPNLAQGEPARPRPFAPTFREGRRASDPGAHSKTPDLAHGTVRGHVRAMVGPLDIRWYGIRFDDRHVIKCLPSHARRWSKPLGCWITSTQVVDDVRLWLQTAGYTVALVDVSSPPTKTAPRLVATPSETSR